MAICSHCGNQVVDGLTACPACGAPMQAQNYNQGYPQQAYAPNGYQQQGYAPNGYAPNGYQQPGYQPAPGATPVKTDRSLLMYILLTIITFGIYGYWFVYSMAKDVNQICEGDGDKVGGLAAYILLSIVTCGVYSWYWLYKVQNRLQAAAPRYGTVVAESGTTVLLWMLVGTLVCAVCSFIGMNIVIKTANKVGACYNARYFNTGYAAY